MNKKTLEKVPSFFCKDIRDYKNDKYNSFDYKTSITRLKRHARTLGDMSSYITSEKGKRFYSSFIDMLMNENLELSKDYFHAESSLISTFSFYLGMIMTKDVAEEKYDIGNLFHLKDDRLKILPKNSLHPDYFGLDSGNRPYLFEAKGRRRKLGKNSGKNPRQDSIDHPRNQLQSVNEVEYKYISYKNSDIKKHIVQTILPTKQANKTISIWDIDPPSNHKEETKIVLHDKVLIDYYKNIIDIESLENDELTERIFNGKNFVGIENKNEKTFIGLQKDILENIKEISKNSEDKSKNNVELIEVHHKIVNENKSFTEKNISIGKDGICYKELKSDYQM